jgi:Fe-S oxidoreductase
LESHIAIKAFLLLESLGIEVEVLPFRDSSRSQISKGFLNEAKQNVNSFINEIAYIANDEIPLLGIEPSAILGFRDDYHRLVDAGNKKILDKISSKTYLIEEFLADYLTKNPLLKEKFTDEKKEIAYHGHCHQKTLSSSKFALDILNFPNNYTVEEIPSGCCGMAGSFGYEHYDLSMKIGEMVLFPRVRKAANQTISASGTSCRHQIKDGTRKKSSHPVEILFDALKN